MKIGLNTWIWEAPFRTDKHMALVPKVKALGADVFEFALEEDSVVDTKALKRALDGEGLSCSIVGLFGEARDLSLDEKAQRAGMDYAKRCIDISVEVGAALYTGAAVGVGGKAFLTADQRRSRLERAATCLRELGEYSSPAGVTVVVEVLNRYENNFINTAAQARELADLVNHPRVGIHLDTFHMGLEENDLGAALRTAGDRLLHLHASESHRGTPGTGLTRWDQVATALKAIHYDGFAVIESFNPYTWIGPLAMFWRTFARTPDDLARYGLDFLRKTLTV